MYLIYFQRCQTFALKPVVSNYGAQLAVTRGTRIPLKQDALKKIRKVCELLRVAMFFIKHVPTILAYLILNDRSGLAQTVWKIPISFSGLFLSFYFI